MRIGTVVGRVTLGARHPSLRGERLLLTLPWTHETFSDPGKKSFSIVVYDELGANVGQEILIAEGREAACPFKTDTPIDAYCAALVDQVHYDAAHDSPNP